ncbi:SGNH/GDSL hydrolase family protein [Telluribacter sp.]|jgi:lysophospholipase L1-like esterase|uniref:SGNH/GDSL hydrolase family protein n=1 Tax=Telluribacter sp. TaxID=1978767 RepID=UPI002E1058EE|nr:SGNH/GDSL hydrolase family protein [Telluribacter sp.]
MNKLKLLFLLVVPLGLFCCFTHKPLSWVAIGDSITYLNEHQDETGNRITRGYMTRVVEKLPYLHYVNQGHNGWTAGRIAQSFDQLGIEKADIYTIFLGTNDWWAGRPLGNLADYTSNTGNATVYGSFRIIINKLRSLNPQAHIILITPMQRTDFVYLFNYKNNAIGSYQARHGQQLEAFAQAIDSIGRLEQIPVLDLYHLRGLRLEKLVKFKRLKNPETGAYQNFTYPAYTRVPFDPATDEYPYPVDAVAQTYDGLHPSDKGYALISQKLIKVLRKY